MLLSNAGSARIGDDLGATAAGWASHRRPLGAGGRRTLAELMTENKPAAADPVSDGSDRSWPAAVRDDPDVAAAEPGDQFARRPVVVGAGVLHLRRPGDRPALTRATGGRCGLEITAVGRRLPRRTAGRRLPHRRSAGGDPTAARPGTCTSWNGIPTTASATDGAADPQPCGLLRFRRSDPCAESCAWGCPRTPARLWITPLVQVKPMRKILRMGSSRRAPMRRILRIPMSRILRI